MMIGAKGCRAPMERSMFGRDRDDYRYDRDRRYNRDRDTTVGVGPGGVSIGPREHCRMVTTTVDRGDGRTYQRRERRCD